MSRLDAQLDRLPLVPDQVRDLGKVQTLDSAALSTPRVRELLRIVKALSTASSSHPLLPSRRILALLSQSGLTSQEPRADGAEPKSHYESELEWVLVSKVTVHAYGLILNTLGVALYRAAAYQEALDTLTRSAALNAKAAEGDQPSDWGFIAMARWQLHQEPEARAALAKLRVLAVMSRWRGNEEVARWLKEAEELIARPP